jgi:hypothetical protein
MSSPYVYVGTLRGSSGNYLILADADGHDLRDTATTRDRYVLDCALHGIHANRQMVWVNVAQIVALSRLSDVIAG